MPAEPPAVDPAAHDPLAVDLLAFDPLAFAALGHDVIARLTAYLQQAQAGDGGPVLPRATPADVAAAFPARFAPGGDVELVAVLTEALARSTAVQAPRCLGHQVAAPLPAAALGELVGSLVNNGMAVWEMGKAGLAMERAVLAFLAAALGLPSSSGGALVSGGSLGNLTALLAARQACGGDVWRQGLRGAPPLCVLVGQTAHFSVARAVHVLGLGDAGVVPVDVDQHLRMVPAALLAAVATERAKGRRIMAVVASAGSTLAGAIDPLPAIADVCRAQGLWLHVDAAHGGSLAVSSTLRPRLAGIERADSVVWDAHKLLLMPAPCTALLFRDARAGALAFGQKEGGALDDDRDCAWADVSRRTVECTKRTMALPLYACLRAYGPDLFARHVERCCGLAAALADLVTARPGLELLVAPDCDIVCFRVKGHDGGQTAAVRRRVVDDGRFYLAQARGPGGLWLRVTLVHPLTTRADLAALLDEVEAAAAALPA